GELGAFSAVLAAELFRVYHWPYLAAVLAGLAAAAVSSLIMEFLVIRRFRNAPRLILTVATIGVAQILGFLELALPPLMEGDRGREEFRTSLQSPWGVSFDFQGVRFTVDSFIVLVVAPAVLIGLFLFFRYTRYGVASRASAENAERARLLGIRVSRVSLVIWTVAGVLSAVTAILQAPILGFQLGAIAGMGLMLRALAAAVIGRMESIPVTIGAAILLTMAEQTIFYTTGQTGYGTAFLLVIIIVALLAQRKGMARVDQGASTWKTVQEVRRIPRELRGVPEVRRARFALFAVLAVFLVLFPFPLGVRNISLASAILTNGIVGISLVMLTGWSGNVSLGQWGFVGFGAMLAGRLATRAVEPDPQMNMFLVMLIAGLAGAAVAVLIGLPALRIRGLFLGVTTLAFAVAAHSYVLQLDLLTPRRTIPRPPLFGRIDIRTEFSFYYIALAAFAFALFCGWNLRRTRQGRNFVALRENEVHAQALGVRPVRTKLAAFAVSGFFAAFAGGLLAYHQQSLTAEQFGAEYSLFVFSMVVIGGLGSMTGAILGAVYVSSVQFYLGAQWQFLATGFGMLFLLMVFPGGLGAIVFSLRDRFLRRVAVRNQIVVPSLVADRRVEEGLFDATMVSEGKIAAAAEPELAVTGERE
ncbi:MAG: ABC transporter permease, partial [Candidatus Binatia bacterium]